MKLYTIGHSTRTSDDFIAILKHYKIQNLVDIRTVPRSRHTPQFNSDALASDMSAHDIKYQHLELLGGLRYAHKDSLNQGWHNKSFRGYADYMQTADFERGIDQLIDITKSGLTAIMCAEVLPWRCHRSMVGDAMLVRDYHVIDIYDSTKATDEKLTSFAQIDGVKISYPDDQARR